MGAFLELVNFLNPTVDLNSKFRPILSSSRSCEHLLSYILKLDDLFFVCLFVQN